MSAQPRRLPDPSLHSPLWQEKQRRMFLLIVVLSVGASMAALWSQAPSFDLLDLWALPLLSVMLLGLQLLLSRSLIRFETALSAAFLGACLYVLLALSHQFRVMPPAARTLSENTYWFAVLYTSVFYVYPPRHAVRAALAILGTAALVCVWHLSFTVPEATRLSLIGASVQFLMVGGVLVLIQATFGAQRAQLLATRTAALVDLLTGIANRRAAEERLRQLAARGAVYTVVLFDIDHFKQINDRHGHAAGDVVLRGVAQLAQTLLPQGGMVARWGGEEFLLILPVLGDTQVRRLLNTLRNELRQQRHGEVVGVTACFGVANAASGEVPETVVARADEAMYSAKQQGRNDIRLADWRRSATGA
ncbi:GGDEF domain-containing protein [Deinococcus aerolatus]|nr:GGDEF domain-containing protein [Deinococcus aerolatus]